MINVLCVVFSLAVAFFMGKHMLLIYLSRKWPTTSGKITETAPQSYFEREGLKFYLNLDSDHFLVYTVDGKEYRHNYGDETNVRIGGIKIWRKTQNSKKRIIRYNALNPIIYIESGSDNPRVYTLGILIISFSIGIAIYCAT